MREIKFRAWDELEKRMWTLEDAGENSGDGSIQYFSENGSLEFGRLEYYDTGLGVNSHFEKFPLMQYTGLKDKNGKEIFEGDLYKFTISHDMYNPESGHTTFEVVHVKAVTFEDSAFYHGTHLLSEIIEFDDSFTYVGNIYENPELLEESQNGTK